MLAAAAGVRQTAPRLSDVVVIMMWRCMMWHCVKYQPAASDGRQFVGGVGRIHITGADNVSCTAGAADGHLRLNALLRVGVSRPRYELRSHPSTVLFSLHENGAHVEGNLPVSMRFVRPSSHCRQIGYPADAPVPAL